MSSSCPLTVSIKQQTPVSFCASSILSAVEDVLSLAWKASQEISMNTSINLLDCISSNMGLFLSPLGLINAAVYYYKSNHLSFL